MNGHFDTLSVKTNSRSFIRTLAASCYIKGNQCPLRSRNGLCENHFSSCLWVTVSVQQHSVNVSTASLPISFLIASFHVSKRGHTHTDTFTTGCQTIAGRTCMFTCWKRPVMRCNADCYTVFQSNRIKFFTKTPIMCANILNIHPFHWSESGISPVLCVRPYGVLE